MNYKSLLLVSFLLLSFMASAQDLEHYLPVGFQNPLLKSGQYIFSTFYNNTNHETEQEGYKAVFGRYGFTTLGYLGITDKITLSTTLFLFPKQTTSEYSGNSTEHQRENLNAQTEIVLS